MKKILIPKQGLEYLFQSSQGAKLHRGGEREEAGGGFCFDRVSELRDFYVVSRVCFLVLYFFLFLGGFTSFKKGK